MEIKEIGSRGRRRKLTPHEEANIIILRQGGKSIAEITFTQGISASTFQRIWRRFKEEEKENN